MSECDRFGSNVRGRRKLQHNKSIGEKRSGPKGWRERDGGPLGNRHQEGSNVNLIRLERTHSHSSFARIHTVNRFNGMNTEMYTAGRLKMMPKVRFVVLVLYAMRDHDYFDKRTKKNVSVSHQRDALLTRNSCELFLFIAAFLAATHTHTHSTKTHFTKDRRPF